MIPRVYNKYHKDAPPDAVYIGRPSRWGNQFPITENCSREQSIALFEKYVEDNPWFQREIELHLRGKNLLCFCKPKACHGDVYIRIANKSKDTKMSSSSRRSSSRSSSSSKSSVQQPLVSENLAVRYRPHVLEDLVGQDHIVSEIRGMFKRNRVPSSIMLAGPTGLGKTTTARIIARYINCSNRDEKTHQPCGECANCKMENHPDVIELNAADTRGIDDVRKLIEQAHNMPSMGAKRLFIIDEAQQLTPQAQQAILRPMEEPPKDTMWIICTMSPDRVLPAIAGRCTKLFVKPVLQEAAVARLYKIARKEGTDFKKIDGGMDVLKAVTDLTNGHMRDAVELLDKTLSMVADSGSVDPKALVKMYSSTGEGNLDEIAADVLLAIMSADPKALISAAATCDNARGVLNKMRWLVDYLMLNSVGSAQFTPYSAKVFSARAKKASVRVNLSRLLTTQALLVNIEVRFNSMSIDERVVFLAMIGEFIVGLQK